MVLRLAVILGSVVVLGLAIILWFIVVLRLAVVLRAIKLLVLAKIFLRLAVKTFRISIRLGVLADETFFVANMRCFADRTDSNEIFDSLNNIPFK